MASKTPAKLQAAALSLFSSRWYETVSVAEVCREAGVSNGVFYRYYRTKEDLVRALLDEFLLHLEEAFAEPAGDLVAQRFESLARAVYGAGAEFSADVTVFREGQYRMPEYEDRLRGIYIRACEHVFGRSISEVEYLYAISGLRFTSTRAIYDGVDRRPEIVTKFVVGGLFPVQDVTAARRIAVPAEYPSIPEHEPADSRERLLETGTRLIGKQGYHAIGVGDIVRETGLAVGTFYTYFKSKDEFFSTIVERIGQRTRHYLSEQARAHSTRLEQEAYGVWHFLSYFNQHPEFYSIVREAEFVAKPWVRRYYDAFEDGYRSNLPISDDATKTVAANFLMGISHYVGIEALLNRRISDIRTFIVQLAELMCTGVQA